MKSLDDLQLMKMLYENSTKMNRITKSYRKGRAYRVQNIYDKNGFTIKQIIHHM